MAEDKKYARKTGKAFINNESPAVDITVSVQDTQKGNLPVIVEWPLVQLHFASLADVRAAFMPFAQFADVQSVVKRLVGECLTELGVEQNKPC